MKWLIFLAFTLPAPLLLAEKATWQRAGQTAWRLVDSERFLKDVKFQHSESGETLRMELNPTAFDASEPIRVLGRPELDEVTVRAFDAEGKPIRINLEKGGAHVEVRAGEVEFQPFDGFSFQLTADSRVRRVEISAPGEHESGMQQVEFSYTPFALTERLDIAPTIAEPRHRPPVTPPDLQMGEKGFVIGNRFQQLTFSTEDGLRLVAWENHFTGADLLAVRDATALFMVEKDGKRFGAREWSIHSVKALEGKTAVEATLRHQELEARFQVEAVEDDLRFHLSIRNLSSKPQIWKTAFPHLGGLRVSSTAEEDYYLFPLYGGVIHTTDANLRSLYSGGSAWWQMISLFSPTSGSGIALWCRDTEGRPKGMALRKGRENPPFATLQTDDGRNGIAPDYLWKQTLEGTEGTSLAIEHPKESVEPGSTAIYPEASLLVHEGGWKMPMKAYADWARKVWEWRPMSDKLRNSWNQQMITMLSPGYKGQKPLLQGDVWYDGYREDRIDVGEFGYWWKWSEKGPFGSSLTNAREEVGERIFTRFRSFFNQRDPKTNKPVYKVNDGDYDYNPSMGGLEGLREAIAKAHGAGASVQFYTTPFLADENTRLGREHGRRFNVMNPYFPPRPVDSLPGAPRGEHMISYAKWRMCLDIEEYQDFLVENRVRIARETGVDAIRFDVLGVGGYACFNPEHEHFIARSGDDLSTMRASKVLVERIRKTAAEQGRPDLLIAAEYPGADFLVATLDSSLGYEMDKWSPAGLRPLPVNLLRFCFPEFKYFDLLHPGRPSKKFPNMVFWNAVGVRGREYPAELHQVLRENSDALSARHAEPLVPTLNREVYANRFDSGEGKSVTLLYHDGKKLFEGPVLAFPADDDRRVVDLLAERELPVAEGQVAVTLNPGDIAAIAQVPRVLEAKREGQGWRVQAEGGARLPNGAVLVVGEGGQTRRFPAKDELQLEESFTGSPVKLIVGEDLVDLIRLL